MAVFLTVLSLSLIGFLIHLCLSKEPKTPARIVELLLLYQLIFSVGISSFLAFIGLGFMSEMVAKLLDWPASPPFEEELANVNLAFGFLGILCIWFRGNFWTATVIGFSIWILADAFGHVYEMIFHHNYSPGNSGVPMYTDFIVPIALLILLALHLKLTVQSPRKLAD